MALDILIAGKYRLGRKLGGGSFGEIFLGTNLQTGEEVGIKLESIKARHPQLLYESKLYKILQGGGERARRGPARSVGKGRAALRPRPALMRSTSCVQRAADAYARGSAHVRPSACCPPPPPPAPAQPASPASAGTASRASTM